jgi:hypothetical protein
VHLIMGQRIDPLLELLDDFIDCRCWLAAGAIMHGRQSSFRRFGAEGSGHATAKAPVRIRSCCGWSERV